MAGLSSLHQNERAPLARCQILHLAVPLQPPRGVAARGQPGKAGSQGPREEGGGAGADVQLGVQELCS